MKTLPFHQFRITTRRFRDS